LLKNLKSKIKSKKRKLDPLWKKKLLKQRRTKLLKKIRKQLLKKKKKAYERWKTLLTNTRHKPQNAKKKKINRAYFQRRYSKIKKKVFKEKKFVKLFNQIIFTYLQRLFILYFKEREIVLRIKCFKSFFLIQPR
jgi:hypothetical protein